jgi:glycosidase
MVHHRKFKSFYFLFLIFFVFCSSEHTWQKSHVNHPEWSKNVSIYEVNIRQYTREGTFKAFGEHLPRLKKMGVGILWLMPIHPIGEKNRKGTLGSYYSVKDFKAVNPEFGTMKDFENLVKKIHDLGMYVLIGWVANHTAWDHIWAITHPEFYVKDSTGNFYFEADWTDIIKLDYKNTELRKQMLDAMVYWIKEKNIDGYRCDVAAKVPTDFWNTVRDTLEKIKPVFMLAEASEPYLHEKAFDMTYAWAVKDLLNDIARGKKTAQDLATYFEEEERIKYPLDAYRMLFTSNHDENSWHGTVFDRLGAAAEIGAVFTCVFRGMPLVYSGQEAGLDKELEFFEKDTIEWREHKFEEIYSILLNLKKRNQALWNGVAGGNVVHLKASGDQAIYSFIREKREDKIVALFNFSSEEREFSINDKLIVGEYENVFSAKRVELEQKSNFRLPPWGCLLFEK